MPSYRPPPLRASSLHPRLAGNGGLYCVDYFRLCREHLNAGGIFSAWLPYYGLSLEDFRVDILVGAGPGARTHSLPMPRFIWRATAYRKEHAIFDLFFDATDVEAGDPLVQVQVYDAFALAFLQELSKDLTKLPFNKRVRQFVAKFSS